MKKTCTPSAHKALNINIIFSNDNIGAGAMLGLGGNAVGRIAAI